MNFFKRLFVKENEEQKEKSEEKGVDNSIQLNTNERDEINQLLSEADSLYKQNENEKAMELYLKVVALDENNALAYHRIGILHNIKGNSRDFTEHAKSLEALEKALSLLKNISDFRGYALIAQNCFLLGKWSEALTACQNADELENDRSKNVGIALTNIIFQLKYYAKKVIEDQQDNDILLLQVTIMNGKKLNILDIHDLLKQALKVDAVIQTKLFEEVFSSLKLIEPVVQPFLEKDNSIGGCETGKIVESDPLFLAKEEAESGKDYAQKLLGFHYHSIGNYREAIKWLYKAAIQGDEDSEMLFKIMLTNESKGLEF